MINIGIPSKGRLRKDILKIFSKNNLPDAIFTLQFFKDINLECIPIIKEYANLNFGALSSNKKQDVKSIKEQELKKIIEKYV